MSVPIARRAVPIRWAMIVAASALALVVLAAPARAIDGAILITQAKALAGGVTAADETGFPVTLSAPGLYRLASNLTTNDPDQTLIEIRARDVRLDLNGFTILGPASCNGEPASCTSTGDGIGVEVISGFAGVTVHDGTVAGMGNAGILQHPALATGGGLAVERVNALGNGGTGVGAGVAAKISRCVVFSNGATGISAGNGSRIVENLVYASGSAGIVAGEGSNVSGNVVERCGGDGVSAGAGSVVARNAVRGNATGIVAASGAGIRVEQNVVNENDGAGVSTGDGARVSANVVTGNTGVGLAGSATTAYEHNVLRSNNAGGDQVTGGIEVGLNMCGTNTTCP